MAGSPIGPASSGRVRAGDPEAVRVEFGVWQSVVRAAGVQSSCRHVNAPGSADRYLLAVNIGAPFRRVAQHIEKAEVVRLEQPPRPQSRVRVLEVPRVFSQEFIALAVIAAGPCAGATCEFPFGARGEAVTDPAHVRSMQRAIIQLRLRRIAPVLFVRELLFAEPLAIG